MKNLKDLKDRATNERLKSTSMKKLSLLKHFVMSLTTPTPLRR